MYDMIQQSMFKRNFFNLFYNFNLVKCIIFYLIFFMVNLFGQPYPS